MESLTLSEARSASRRRISTQNQRRSARLPTPEASRSSNDALDTVSNPEDARRGTSLEDPKSRPYFGGSITTPNSPNTSSIKHAYGRYQSAPHSPPYRASDAQRPSLPPLKTVLGDNMSSPPQTPTSFSATIQPLPREPAYHTGTFKPPSLYPNKKQRTGPTTDTAPAFDCAGTFDSATPAAPSFALERRPLPSRSDPPGTDSKFLEAASMRRFSVQHPSRPSRRHLETAAGPYMISAEDPRSSKGYPHYRSPDQMPTSTLGGRKFPPATSPYHSSHNISPARTQPHFEHRLDYPATRRPLQDNHRSRFERISDYPMRRSSNYTAHGAAEAVSEFRADCHDNHTERSDNSFHNGASVFDRMPYDTQPSFFMPSQYEYQHGKSRKRSNLPKQSTDIMKNWFDQNMTNPYPSEEQKAVFSGATGISMTQVSNWFINHRRRCPELRDRRERHRGNGREADMI